MNHLLGFYGTECPSCEEMDFLVKKLEKEEKIKIEMFEVWHNKENEKRLIELDRNRCGGVPFFYNLKTKKFICGEVDYMEFKNWAKDK